jgi:hypothetical protein
MYNMHEINSRTSVHFTGFFTQPYKKFLFNGVVESLMTTLVHVVKSIARGAAPTFATHHVDA